MATLKITQRKSAIGQSPAQRGTLRALGLRKIGHSVVRPDTPDIRGMIGRIRHLVTAEEQS
jgi:large subunit ribosomal protein L30